MPCPSGKRMHANREDALAALAEIIRRGMTGERRTDQHAEVAAYPCFKCGAWHLTSRPEQPERIVQI